MKVFLGGSISLNHLDSSVVSKLDSLMSEGAEFLIGDAGGADRLLQNHLAKHTYLQVSVFFSGSRLRNNLGRWRCYKIDSNPAAKGHAKHSAKDVEMGLQADMGLMVWDGKSSGTLRNALDLIVQGKACYVYFLTEGVLTKFDSEIELESHVSAVNPDAFREATKRLSKGRRELDAIQGTLFEFLD